jgi:hypothetical protein
MLFFKSDSKKLESLLKKKGPELIAIIERKWVKSSFEFIKYITVSQMSGRPGLKRKSGALARSWYPLVGRREGNDLAARVITDSPYAKIHQNGGVIQRRARPQMNVEFKTSKRGIHRFAKEGKGNTKKHVSIGEYSIRIPKRLHVTESFEDQGLKIYIHDVREAMKEICR